MNNNKILIGIFLIVIVLMTIYQSQTSSQTKTLMTDYNTEEMTNAIDSARNTIDHFISIFENPNDGERDFFIKIAITDEENVEHFWLENIEINDEQFYGVINNQPGTISSVKFGDRVSFSKDDITDWMYRTKENIAIGGFTTRVLLESMPQEEQEKFKEALGW